MKNFTILFLLIFTLTKIHAQNYQISFSGTGASTSVDSVKVENLNQCTTLKMSGKDILHLTGTAGIDEQNTSMNNTILIYPNPMTGNCSVNFNALAQSKTTISLYDISGKRIIQVQELLSKGHHTYSLTGINSGIYTLRIQSDKYSYTSKIISNNPTIGTTEIKHTASTRDIDNQTANLMKLKSVNSLINMVFTVGDTLKLTGKSGIYRTVFMLAPTKTQTITFNFVACTDYDGNNYSVVKIGAQVWMAENLKTGHYRNGIAIPNQTDNNLWDSLKTGAYCDYNNTPANSKIYGKLYNFYAVVDSRNVCPTGWHVPSDSELFVLATSLGGQSIAGGKMKEACSTLWQSPNKGATNESGFTALPAGDRDYGGVFSYMGTYTYFRSSTEQAPTRAWGLGVWNDGVDAFRFFGMKYYGLSVRCVK